MSERILSQLAYVQNLEISLLVWENANSQEQLLASLSKNVGTGLKELYIMIKDTANEIPSLSFPQIQRPFPHPSESSGLKRRIKLKRLVVSTWEDYSCTHMTRPLDPGPAPSPEIWIENAITYARLFPGLAELRLWEYSFVIIRERDGIHAERSEENFELPFVRDFDNYDEHEIPQPPETNAKRSSTESRRTVLPHRGNKGVVQGPK